MEYCALKFCYAVVVNAQALLKTSWLSQAVQHAGVRTQHRHGDDFPPFTALTIRQGFLKCTQKAAQQQVKCCSCTDVNVLLCCGTKTCQDSSRRMTGFLSLETSFSNTHFMCELPVHFLQQSFTAAFSMELGRGLFKKGGNYQSFLNVSLFLGLETGFFPPPGRWESLHAQWSLNDTSPKPPGLLQLTWEMITAPQSLT